MLEMSLQEKMALLAVASKALEFKGEMKHGMYAAGRGTEWLQYDAACGQALKVLAKLDRDFPGMLPVPHDGVAWAERGE